MSRLYGYFDMTYKAGTTTIEQLKTAVVKGYITAEEFEQISGQPYVV